MRAPGRHPAFSRLVHESDSMARVIDTATHLATGDQTVLIFGAAGTGKGLLARGIHYASERSKEPFVELDCAGLPEEVLAVELFGGDSAGDARSTGLLRLAGKGTALLRQIHALSPALQGRLAYTLSREVSARILVSSKVPVESWLLDGRFDQDLFRILNGATLRIPPLTARGQDAVLIANEALLDHGLNRRETPKELSPEATDGLMEHSWPGNVRELLHVVTSAADRAEGHVIDRDDLVIRHRRSTTSKPISTTIEIPQKGVTMKWIEEEAVRITLELTGGNRSQAARCLGISRPTLLKKIRQLEARTASAPKEDDPVLV